MDPDTDAEDLSERVAELEATVSKMLPNRRGVLKGLGAAAIGGAAVGGATGGASGQSSTGQVGTESEPVDVITGDLSVGSLSTENSFTDPAGVEHTGELADLSDTGGAFGIEDSGATVLSDASGINFGTELDASDDGDGSVTASVVADVVTDGDGVDREIWVIANGASDPAGADPEDIIFEEEA